MQAAIPIPGNSCERFTYSPSNEVYSLQRGLRANLCNAAMPTGGAAHLFPRPAQEPSFPGGSRCASCRKSTFVLLAIAVFEALLPDLAGMLLTNRARHSGDTENCAQRRGGMSGSARDVSGFG